MCIHLSLEKKDGGIGIPDGSVYTKEEGIDLHGIQWHKLHGDLTN